MKDVKLTNFQIGIFVVIIVALVVMYRQGVFKAEKGYQTNPEKAPDGSTPTKDPNDYRNIATSFRESLLENNFSSDIFVSACNSLLVLDDADLMSVSNAYNKLFRGSEYNTLRSVLVQEYAIWGESAEKKRALLDRFNEVGI